MPRARKLENWTYKTGHRGANRVRVFLHPSGMLFAEYRQNGRRIRQSLHHADRERAKRDADELAARLRRPDQVEALPLGQIFDRYLAEKTITKAYSTQLHDRRAIELFIQVFGAATRADTLTHRDADRFVAERKRWGDLRPRAKPKKGEPKAEHHPIGSRIIASDLKTLKAILRWAEGAGWLYRNPLQNYRVSEEGTPRRPYFTGPQYQALLSVSGSFPWQFRCLIVLAHETGHRLGSILSLRWSDIDFEADRITWRQETDKIGNEHKTPMTNEARTTFADARQRAFGIGNTPVLPSPVNAAEEISRHLARDWLERAQVAAGLPLERGRGFHAFRRQFASELRHIPLRDLCDLGGWKDLNTIFKCYQRPNEDSMRQAQASRRTLEA